GLDTHSQYVDPLFNDAPGFLQGTWPGFPTGITSDFLIVSDAHVGDLTLQATSTLIDAGVIIRGVNDWRYTGAAPEIGAFEFAVGPTATNDSRNVNEDEA